MLLTGPALRRSLTPAATGASRRGRTSALDDRLSVAGRADQQGQPDDQVESLRAGLAMACGLDSVQKQARSQDQTEQADHRVEDDRSRPAIPGRRIRRCSRRPGRRTAGLDLSWLLREDEIR